MLNSLCVDWFNENFQQNLDTTDQEIQRNVIPSKKFAINIYILNRLS